MTFVTLSNPSGMPFYQFRNYVFLYLLMGIRCQVYLDPCFTKQRLGAIWS